MLKLTDITKTFNAGTINEKTALNGLSLELQEGDFVTVIGGKFISGQTLTKGGYQSKSTSPQVSLQW